MHPHLCNPPVSEDTPFGRGPPLEKGRLLGISLSLKSIPISFDVAEFSMNFCITKLMIPLPISKFFPQKNHKKKFTLPNQNSHKNSPPPPPDQKPTPPPSPIGLIGPIGLIDSPHNKNGRRRPFCGANLSILIPLEALPFGERHPNSSTIKRS